MKICELLNSSERWTKNVCARDESGCSVRSNSDSAVKWCLEGASNKCYLDTNERLIARAILIDLISKEFGSFHCLSDFNDDYKTDFEKVKRLLEKANV